MIWESRCINPPTTQVKAVRAEALNWVKDQPFPRRGVLHFDGVKVNLGSKNGNRRVEHLAVTVTGLGEEYKIGIFECANGSGNHQWQCFTILSLQ